MYYGEGCEPYGNIIGITCDYTCPGECLYEGPFEWDDFYPENSAELVEYLCVALDGGPGDAAPENDSGGG